MKTKHNKTPTKKTEKLKFLGFFLGFHDLISPVNAICWIALGTAEVGDPTSLSPVLPVFWWSSMQGKENVVVVWSVQAKNSFPLVLHLNGQPHMTVHGFV